MASSAPNVPSEAESRRLAEESRETEWAGRTFIRELFLGTLALPLIHPFPEREPDSPEFAAFYQRLRDFLLHEVDSAAIDHTGEYPEQVVDGLRRLGAFGIKIPKEYGGLGFSVSEYCRAMEMVGSYDANISALLSAHQSIGVPQPLKLFGTHQQKEKYLKRCAAGAISAFALTEPHVGSDPASLSTTAIVEGDGFVLNGEKLWCTNGTLAELLVVMARNPETNKISAFVVETAWPGVNVEHRCRFMGLKALANGVISFKDVFVPRENLIGEEGKGLKIAALPSILAFYLRWYPILWLRGIGNLGRYAEWGALATHLRFIDRASRKLARESFHGMSIYQAKMERKQGFLFRAVDIVMELFVMAATVSHARRMKDDDHPSAARAMELTDLFCRESRRKVKRLFHELWSNEDARKNDVASRVLTGDYDWLKAGAMDLGWTIDTFRTHALSEVGRAASSAARKKADRAAAS